MVVLYVTHALSELYVIVTYVMYAMHAVFDAICVTRVRVT